MAGVFEDITLEWGGEQHKIRARKVLGAIAVVEDVVTLAELARYAERKTAPLARIAAAYGALLRYAGAAVEDDEVYAGMFGAGVEQSAMVEALAALVGLMTPPAAMRSASSSESSPGN